MAYRHQIFSTVDMPISFSTRYEPNSIKYQLKFAISHSYDKILLANLPPTYYLQQDNQHLQIPQMHL